MSAIWLITGASAGSGRLLAERLASAGNHVIAVARRALWPSEETRSKESEAYCNRSLTSCAAAEKPPHWLLLGGPAYEMAMHKLDELRAEFSTWERLTRSADFPVDDQGASC